MAAALKVFRNGAWHELTSLKVYRSGAWRQLKTFKVYSGGAWRLIGAFIQALSVSISDTVTSTIASRDPVTHEPTDYAISHAATATPAGGLGPFSYAWTIVSGSGWTISSPSSASTTIYGRTSSATTATARVTVTDSSGQTATADLALSTLIA